MKNKDASLDIILYPTVVIVGFFIRILPARVSLWIARKAGLLAYVFYGKRRSIGYANVKAAFCDTMPPGKIRVITRRTFQHFAQVLFEIFKFPIINERYASHYVSCEGLGLIKDALKKGRGAIILTAHFGNWELSGLIGAMKGYPQDVLARQQKHLRLNKLLNNYRARYGRRVIEKGIATREIISSLKANKIVAILSDQDGGARGSLVNFFNRLASTPQGAAAFALKYDSALLPAFCAREKGPRYRMIVAKPMALDRTGDSDVDIQLNLQKFTDILQSYITKYPDQWLWLHKRWKTTPSRRILILGDGRAGHLNQARAVAKQLKRVVFERAEKDERIGVLRRAVNHRPSAASLEDLIYQERIVEIRYKSPAHKAVLNICGLFASRQCQGCMKCVRFCLTKDSYKAIMSVYADVVVSAGSSTAALNRFLCKENRARGIAIMKPGILPASAFDLNIIPRHDRPKNQKNILAIDGALNLIDENYLKEQAEKFGFKPRLSIGLLLGGDSKNFVLTKDALEKVLDGIVRAASGANAEIFATTSRRTSKDLETVVKAKLSNSDNSKLLIIANEKNIPEAVGGILGLSDVVVVSGESISMVSEAASSGKKVVVFKPQLKGPAERLKHLIFLENLKEKGYITLCQPEDMADTIKRKLQDAAPVKRLDDSALVYEAVKRIV